MVITLASRRSSGTWALRSPFRYRVELFSEPTQEKPRWGSEPPGWAIASFSVAGSLKKDLFCHRMVSQAFHLSIDREHRIVLGNKKKTTRTHFSSSLMVSLETPWPTSFTNPCCDRLSSSSDASCWRSRGVPWVYKDRSNVASAITRWDILYKLQNSCRIYHFDLIKCKNPHSMHVASLTFTACPLIQTFDLTQKLRTFIVW